MNCVDTPNRAIIASLRNAKYDFDEQSGRVTPNALIAKDAVIHTPLLFIGLQGFGALYETCYAPLREAIL